jgi:nitroreductase
MQLDETIRTRRSVRSYQARELPPPLVDEILDLARHAPSSMDGQPWCFVVLRDPETKRRLADLKNAYCPPQKRVYPADFLAEAPVIVAVCVHKSRSHGRELENGILATGFLLLAAHARGLAGVYLSAYQKEDPRLAEQIARLLRLGPDVQPVTVVPLGFPREAPPPKLLRPLETMIHHESFDLGLL